MNDPEPPFDPDYDQGRHPVQNNDAEMAVLGALILEPELAPKLALELNRDDFYKPQHTTIWDACQTITSQLTGDIRLDAVVLADHLTRTGALTRVGGAPYLHTLTQACPIPGNATFYAEQVREAARLRTIQELGTGFLQLVNRTDPADLEHAFTTAYDKLDQAAARIGPTTPTAGQTTTGLHDLTWILTGQPPVQDPPAYATRTDGHALFYAGKVNGIFGDPECGKTWLAQAAIVEALNAGKSAAMIDVDHNGPDHTAARLLLLGARIEHIADPDRFRYYEPEEADQLRAAITDITNRAPAVVVIDSLGEILPMLGVKSTDNDEITTALRLICQPPANAGSCVITIDHLPKSTEARITGYAIGGTAKKRIMRGAYIRAEARTQPAPGQIGRITLRIEKDTVGELRKVTPGGYAGTFILDSTHGHITAWSIDREDMPANDDGSFRPTSLMQRISVFIEENDQCNFSDIKEAIGGKDTWLRQAIHSLVVDGHVARLQGARNAKLHHCIAPYREAEDDKA